MPSTKKDETAGFDPLGLMPSLAAAVTALGYEEPTPIQAGIIPLMLSGPRSGGKSRRVERRPGLAMTGGFAPWECGKQSQAASS